MPNASNDPNGKEPSDLDFAKIGLEAEWLEFEREKHRLKGYELLYQGARERWKDRRENEWKLNYAIWLGIAAFDGALLTSKINLNLSIWQCVGIGAIPVAIHGLYLWPTTERAIAEIEMQRSVEHGIRKLIKDEAINPKHMGGAVHQFDRLGPVLSGAWKRYGLVIPVAVTAALMAVSGYLMHRP